MNFIGEDKRLIDYLLGRLPEQDQLRLEEEYLADAALQQRLLLAEDDLVEGYLRGELSPDERAHLESRFLSSPRGRRKLELARSLMAVAESAGRQPALARQESAQALRARRFPIFAIRLALAGATLALLLLLVWSIRDRSRRAPDNAGNHQQSPQTSTAQSSATPVQRESPSVQLPEIASIILEPAGRNAEQFPRLKIPARVFRVRFELALARANHKTYQVTLLDSRDDTKWSGHGFRPLNTASGERLDFTLPATLFKNGEYTFMLSPDEESASPIGAYAFVVTQK